ncbi:MAG: DinB family protein [Holophagaceae bacterium]|nr:DinB family protein [Holophagaceae bacterium]
MTRELASFSKELDLFQDESLIWKTVPGVSNPVGSLVLHVCGNLQHFVGAVLGGTGYVRNRELEFSLRGVSRASLSAELQKTIAAVDSVLSTLAEQSLAADYPERLGGFQVPTGMFLLHLNTHLAHHLGQAGYLRRILSGDNLSSGPIAISALSGSN